MSPTLSPLRLTNASAGYEAWYRGGDLGGADGRPGAPARPGEHAADDRSVFCAIVFALISAVTAPTPELSPDSVDNLPRRVVLRSDANRICLMNPANRLAGFTGC